MYYIDLLALGNTEGNQSFIFSLSLRQYYQMVLSLSLLVDFQNTH